MKINKDYIKVMRRGCFLLKQQEKYKKKISLFELYYLKIMGFWFNKGVLTILKKGRANEKNI